MKKDEFLAKIKEIGTLEDIETVRASLTELSDNVSIVFDSNDELSTEINQYKEDNETLRKANMKLFLRLGDDKSPEEIKKDQVGELEKEKEPRKFEDLFNEKGDLK